MSNYFIAFGSGLVALLLLFFNLFLIAPVVFSGQQSLEAFQIRPDDHVYGDKKMNTRFTGLVFSIIESPERKIGILHNGLSETGFLKRHSNAEEMYKKYYGVELPCYRLYASKTTYWFLHLAYFIVINLLIIVFSGVCYGALKGG